jgi:hypothetical protein
MDIKFFIDYIYYNRLLSIKMSNVELKSIMVKRDSLRTKSGSFDSIDVNRMDIDCSKNMRKVFTYKLFNDALMEIVVNRMKINDNLLFCGFVIDSEFDVTFKNEHFCHSTELSHLKNSFMENNKSYLSEIVQNRFWFKNFLKINNRLDEINILIPSDKGFSVPRVKVVFVEYEKWITGCLFKNTHYRVIEGSELHSEQ